MTRYRILCWHQDCLGAYADCESIGETYWWARAHLKRLGEDHADTIRAHALEMPCKDSKAG